MRAGQRLTIVMILCAAFVIGAFLYPRYEKPQETETTSPSEPTISPPASCAQLLLDKSTFDRGEEIKFTLKNRCDHPITLKNSAPWKIRDKLGRVVYSPIALQVIVKVDSGESKIWMWNQRDQRGNQVGPGTYTIVLETTDAGTLTKTFRIR